VFVPKVHTSLHVMKPRLVELLDLLVNSFDGLTAPERNELHQLVYELAEQSAPHACSQQRLEQIYQAYPLKVGKPAALKAITKAIKRGTEPDKLLRLTKAYAAARDGNKDFCPHPATWFNQERYNDDPATWNPVIAGPTRPRAERCI